MTKIYTLVKTLLTENAELRDSDKKLIWAVMDKCGFVKYSSGIGQYMDYANFLESLSTESIRRCRQKIQELHPELRSSEGVQKAKDEKRKTKSTFIYREVVPTRQDISAPVNVMEKLKQKMIEDGTFDKFKR